MKLLKFGLHDSEDGYYCVSCKNRGCSCLPPIFRWKPVGVEIKIPNIEKDELEV